MTRNRTHVCGAYLAFVTQEHLDALAYGSNPRDIKLCQAHFPETTFSDANFKRRKISFPLTYQSKRSLLKHFERSKSKAIFLQSPYLDHYPEWFFGLHESAHLAYGGYSLSLVDYFQGQYGAELIKNSKYLLAGSHDEYKNYQKYGNKDSLTVLTGNPLMYKLRKKLQLDSNLKRENEILLWAPHWIEQWEENAKGFARWEAAIRSVTIFAEENIHKKVIVRPHPLLRNILEAYLDNETQILNRESRIASLSDLVTEILPCMKILLELSNVQLSNSSMMEDVLSADMLITEGVSIIGYWATTGKPILVLRDEMSPKFNKEGEQLLLATEQTTDVDDVLDWVQSASRLSTTKVNMSLIELSQSIHPTFKKSPIELVVEHM